MIRLARNRRSLAVLVAAGVLTCGPVSTLRAGAASAAATVSPTILVPFQQPTIQAGINAASNGDTVLVAPGVYHGDIDYHGKAVRVMSQAGPGKTTIDGGGQHFVVTFVSAEPAGALLQGFTITGGAPTSGDGNGGGVQITNASPTVVGNVITANTTCNGGAGVEVQGGAPVILGNVVSHDNDHGCSGPPIGAINILQSGALIASNLVEYNNGPGINDREDAAGHSSVVVGNVVESNAAAGVIAAGPVVVVQNLVVDNVAGIEVDASDLGSVPTIANNTVSGNTDAQLVLSGPLIDVPVVNNIFAGTFAVSPIRCIAFTGAPTAAFSHNDAWSPSTPASTGPCPAITGSGANISRDPDFTPSFQLAQGSPCVDAGTNSTPVTLPTDIASQGRVVDGNADGVATIDIGVFEQQPHPVEPPVPQPTVIRVPGPYATIQKAIDAATDGEIILVAPGTYKENLDYHGKSIAIASSGGPTATTIDGGVAGRAVSFSGGEPRSAVLVGFTVTHGGVGVNGASSSIIGNVIENNPGYGGGAIAFNGSPLIAGNIIVDKTPSASGPPGPGIQGSAGAAVIVNNIVADNPAGLDLQIAHGTLIADNIFVNNLGTAVNLAGEEDIAVIQNLIVDNGSGIAISPIGDPETTQIVVSNTIMGTGAQIYFARFVSQDIIVNNILSGPNPVDCGDSLATPPTFSHNDLDPIGTAATVGPCTAVVGSAGNISAKPGFGSGTFSPAAGSGCINAGTTAAPLVLPMDLAGKPRVVGGAIDIGAFEHQGPY